MLNRRDFLKYSSTTALGTALSANALNTILLDKINSQDVGLQLFTCFNQIDEDVPGVLKKIADIGYKEIESAFSKKGGFYGMKPKEFATFIKDLGMSWKSHHVIGAPFKMPKGMKLPTTPDGKPMVIPTMKNLRDNAQELVDSVAEGGVQYLVCANIPVETLDEVKAAVEILNKSGEICNKANINFCYHNHDAEFKTVEGKIPYDILLSEIKPELMKMELDLAWATKAGIDPVDLFKKHPGRFPLWHVKDISKDFKTIKPVGEGVVDFKHIFKHAKKAGMKHFFVEHDMPADPYASITASINNLRKM